MKHIAYLLLIAAMMTGCGQKPKDSAALADSANMTKDSADKVHPASVGQEISGDDAKFAVKAAAGGMEEVELGKLAQQKGSSPAIRNFGTMMVKDHSAANNELAEIAKNKKILLPGTLDDAAVKLKAELSTKNGQEFDKAYVDAMVNDHQQDTTDFDRAIKVCKYPEISGFAKKTLPVLKMHLAAAQQIKSTY